MAIPTLKDWRAELLRLTVFTSDVIPATSLDWWKELTGSEPESTSNKPQVGARSAVGRLLDAQFILNVVPGRIDWILAGTPSVDNPVPIIGQYTDSEKQFANIIKKWLENCPVSILRIACGAIVTFPVDNKLEGYRLLDRLLPALDIDGEGSADLLYQINRPRASRVVPSLMVNRLSKWQSLQLSLVESTSGTKTEISCFCRAEIDANTAADNKNNLAQHAIRLMDELFGLVREIVEHGDIP